MKLIGQLLSGSVISLEVFFLTLIMSLPLGFLVALGRMSKVKVVRVLVDTYIQIMRGTPLLLQLLFFYFAPFYIFGASLPRFASAILAFVLNYAAYFAEIYRSGLQALDRGQHEAAKALGMSYGAVDEIAKMIPRELGITLDKALNNKDLREAYDTRPEIKQLILIHFLD